MPVAKPLLEGFARRLPGAPALVVSDSDAFTWYMSHVVPGCEFLLLTATVGSDVYVHVVRSVVPGACQPLRAPHFREAVPPIESITPTNRPSLPRRSFRSMYSMHA